MSPQAERGPRHRPRAARGARPGIRGGGVLDAPGRDHGRERGEPRAARAVRIRTRRRHARDGPRRQRPMARRGADGAPKRSSRDVTAVGRSSRPGRVGRRPSPPRSATPRPSLPRMFETWTPAVLSLMNSCSAMRRLVWPSTSSARTSRSRAVRPWSSAGGTGPRLRRARLDGCRRRDLDT